jgi:DNA-binding FadR family transcriptional regulator
MELVALGLLDRTEEPVGSARLAIELRQAGIEVAEVTAGRFLRYLDKSGLSRSVNSTRGRVITEEGRGRLQELRRAMRLNEQGAQVLEAVSTTQIEDLVDLLHLRRAVEAEAARTAAIRASSEEIDRICAFAEAHVREAGQGAPIAGPSMAFHRMLVEASHNRMVIAVGLLLLDPANDSLEKLLEAIAQDRGVVNEHVADHLRLGEALRARDPRAAEETSREHIDRLIRTAEAYRDRTAMDSPRS